MNNQNELEDVLKQIKNEEDAIVNTADEAEYTANDNINVKCLNVMAYINLILSIIGTILVLVNYSKSEITDEFSFVGIVGAIGVLIAGLTLFFLLRTIVDIYWKVKNNEK